MIVWIADSSKRANKLRKILKKFNNISRIEVYNSTESILNKNSTDSCNVLFISADTPEINWVKVINEIKDHCKECNIIFYSSAELNQRDYLRYRISGFLKYPFDEQEVEQELDNLRFTIKK